MYKWYPYLFSYVVFDLRTNKHRYPVMGQYRTCENIGSGGCEVLKSAVTSQSLGNRG